jgi:PAS domain S-box-containing protein
VPIDIHGRFVNLKKPIAFWEKGVFNGLFAMQTKHHNHTNLTTGAFPYAGTEEKFGRLFSLLQSGVAVFQRKGNGRNYFLQDLNKSGERILALTRENAFGENLFDIFGGPEPSELPELIHRIYTTGDPETMNCSPHPKSHVAPLLKTTFYKISKKEIIAVFDERENSFRDGMTAFKTDELLAVLFSQSHFMIVQLDTNFNYVRVSSAYAKANGRSPEFYIGRNFFDLYPDKVDAAFFRSAIKRKAPVSCLVRRHRPQNSPEGTEVFRNWDILPLKDGSGEVKELLVCMFDITDHFKVSKLLGESEERFNSFFSDAPAGLGMLDENLRYLKVNQTYADLNGLTMEDHIGRHLSEVVPDLAPKVIPIFQQVIDTRKAVVNYEYSGSRRGGPEKMNSTGYWVVSAFPVHWSNKRGIGYIVFDITPLRRAEERLKKSETLLQSAFDGLSIPMIVVEKDRTVRFYNKAARDYYGVSAGKELGKPCHLGLRKESAPCEGCDVWEAIPKGVPTTIERKGLMNPDLIEIVRIYPWLGAGGELTGAIMTISDETQNRLLERQITQNQKLASIGLLVSGIAHEVSNANNFVTFNIPILRQYFNAILPIVEIHAQHNPDFELFGMPMEEFYKDLFGLVENLEYGSDRVKATVSALKDFSRIGTEEKRSWMKMEEVVSRVITICRSELTNRVKSFELDIPPALPLMLLDTKALEQVLVNLVVNAAHAVDKEASWIKLRVHPGAEKRGIVTIEVSDNGTGMDKKTRERIFDPFFTTKAPGAGTGLGLYICRNLIEGLGGKIKVSSDPGNGTSFKVILPLMENARP